MRQGCHILIRNDNWQPYAHLYCCPCILYQTFFHEQYILRNRIGQRVTILVDFCMSQGFIPPDAFLLAHAKTLEIPFCNAPPADLASSYCNLP